MYDTLFPLPAWFLSDHDHPVGVVTLLGTSPAADAEGEACVCFPVFTASDAAEHFAGSNRAGSPVPVRTPRALLELLASGIGPGYTHVAYMGGDGQLRRVRRLPDAIRALCERRAAPPVASSPAVSSR